MLFGMAWLVLFYSCHVEDDVVEPVYTKAVKETLFNREQMPLVTVSNRLFFRL